VVSHAQEGRKAQEAEGWAVGVPLLCAGEDGVILRRVSVFGRSAEEALKKGRELQLKHEWGLVPAKDPAPGPAHPGVEIPPGPPSLGCKATALTYEGGRSFEPCTGPRFKPS